MVTEIPVNGKTISLIQDCPECGGSGETLFRGHLINLCENCSENNLPTGKVWKEIWKNINGWEGLYSVSTYGRVKSYARVVYGRNGSVRTKKGESFLKGSETAQGYLIVTLKNRGKKKTCSIHRLVASSFIGLIPQDKIVDHIDMDRKNNRLENLRIEDRHLNINNSTYLCGGTSQFHGVSFSKKDNRYLAKISHYGKGVYVGYFRTEIEAAKAYDKKAVELNGDNAKTNKKLGLL